MFQQILMSIEGNKVITHSYKQSNSYKKLFKITKGNLHHQEVRCQQKTLREEGQKLQKHGRAYVDIGACKGAQFSV